MSGFETPQTEVQRMSKEFGTYRHLCAVGCPHTKASCAPDCSIGRQGGRDCSADMCRCIVMTCNVMTVASDSVGIVSGRIFKMREVANGEVDILTVCTKKNMCCKV